MIKKILSKFLNKKQEIKAPNEDVKKINDNNLEILITLTPNYEIDILVYLKDTPQEPLTEIEYALVCCEFINSTFSTNIKKEIISIINKDIKTEKNSKLIESISILSNVNSLFSDDDLYIKPSQVFNTHPAP
jgi:hypothetical protein